MHADGQHMYGADDYYLNPLRTLVQRCNQGVLALACLRGLLPAATPSPILFPMP